MNSPHGPEIEPDVLTAAEASRLRLIARLAVIDITPLRRHRDFRLFMGGRALSFFGDMITITAVSFQVYALTHSSLMVGLLGLAELVPLLALAFLGGALADAVDRRRLVQVTELGQAAGSVMLMVNAMLPGPQLWLIFVGAAAINAFASLQNPSISALIPRLVDRDELVAASALNSIRTTGGMIGGPAVGGLLIAGFGLPVTYAADVGTFVFCFSLLSLMHAVPPPPDAERPSVQRVLEGLRYARSRPELMGTYLVDMVAMFFGMPNALFPAVAVRFGGARALGLLLAAPAVGSFLAVATSGWSNRVHRHGRAIVVAAVSWGLAIVAFGLAPDLPLVLVCLAIAGGADMISGIFRNALWNQTIPDSLRGRLASIEMLSYSTGPLLGNVEAGGVASAFSVRASIVSGGILCVAGTALLAVFLPAFWSYDREAVPVDNATDRGEGVTSRRPPAR